jgi:uncharacterized membrane protein
MVKENAVNNSTRVATVAILALAGILVAAMGYKFLADHWEDIKTLVIVALVLGGTFSVAVGGLKLRSGK